METTRPYTFDRVVRILIGSAVLIILFLLLKRLSSVLLPFFIAWLMAYLLHPFVRFFQYKLKLKNRILSIVCTLVLFLSAITGILMVLVPMISNEVQKLIDIIGLYTQESLWIQLFRSHGKTKFVCTFRSSTCNRF